MIFTDLFKRFGNLNGTLLGSVFLYWIGSIFFGYDSQLFNGLQAIPAFLAQFGEPASPAAKVIKRAAAADAGGAFKLPASRRSLMASMPFFGKFIGCLVIPWIGHRIGRKKSYALLCVIQIIGATIQASAKHWVQFLIGRIVVYFAVGLVDVVVPSYQAEVVPAYIRGFFVGSLQLLLSVGHLLAAGVSRAYNHETDKVGWLIPVVIQVFFGVIVLVPLWWTPESPRWLISKGRIEAAEKNLNRIRKKQEVADSTTALELENLIKAQEEGDERTLMSLKDLFKGNNPRRLFIAIGMGAAQQLTGHAFVVTYSTIFYLSVGFSRDQAFDYSLILNGAGMVAAFTGMFVMDWVGRRPLLIVGAAFQAFFNFLLAGLASSPPYNGAVKHMIVACIMMQQMFVQSTTTPLLPVVTTECASQGSREIFMGAAMASNVVVAFAISYSMPYLIGADYANLGPKVGYIFGAGGILVLLFAIFFVPELKGRSLEEADELFGANLWAWQFSSYKCKGAAAALEAVENQNTNTSRPVQRGEKPAEAMVEKASENGSLSDRTP